MADTWSLVLAGWPWWAAVPVGAALAWAALRLQREEIAHLDPHRRRILRALRAAAALALVLPLVEPALAWTGSRLVPQRLVVLIDRSHSMAARDPDAPPGDRLDEAVALGLLDPAARPDGPRRAAERLRAAATAPAVADISAAAESAAGTPPAERLAALIDRERRRLVRPVAAGEALALAADLDRVHRDADAALARSGTGAAAGALAALARMDRIGRARLLAQRHLAGGGAEREVLVFADGGAARPDDGRSPADGAATDPGSVLADLARGWDRERPGTVVLLGDGRQTAGPDPVGPARALAARGVRIHPVLIGAPGRPRDAVVAELTGAPEVFRGERVRIECRLRITAEPDSAWDLVFTRDGEEVERRPLRPSDGWQVERLERPADAAGTFVWRARLEPTAGRGVRGGGGLVREVWRAPGGQDLDALRAPEREADETVPAGAQVVDERGDHGSRIRGLIIAPQTGLYTFWITGDDRAELRLSTSADPAGLRTLAAAPAHTGRDAWDTYQAQRSAPVALAAGRAYAIEILHRQAGGDGHVAVGWQLPDGRLERPLAADRLAPPATAAAAADPVDALAEASLANNAAALTVTVSDDPLRVLVLDHQPRWDLRYAAGLLERDRRVDLDARYAAIRGGRGRTDLLPADQAGWDAFDAVLLGDLSPVELAQADQARLRDYVGRRGGFLVVVSGPRAMPAGFPLGPVADLLPVRPPLAGGGPVTPTTLVLGRDGADHPVTRVLGDAERNRRLWPLLPALPWWLPGCTPKPGAQVLLAAENRDPVAVLGRYGAGRVLWMASDETWRWRDRLGDRVHGVFWLQALRWGLAARLRGQDPRLQAALEPAEVEPGGRAELRLRSRDGAPRITVERLDDAGAPVPGTAWSPAAAPVAEVEALYTAALRGPVGEGLAEGRWRVVAEAAGVREERILSVRARPSLEGIELGADAGAWDRVAAAAGTRRLAPADLPALGADLARLEPRRETVRRTWSLWDGWWLAAVIAALLGSEWWLRRRWGLP
jgi:hypothetical protein